MRMDPKHQFAAQYVLSRAAAERRERENFLAAVTATNSMGGPGSPHSVHSDTSSSNNGEVDGPGGGGSTSSVSNAPHNSMAAAVAAVAAAAAAGASGNVTVPTGGRLSVSPADNQIPLVLHHNNNNTTTNNNNNNNNQAAVKLAELMAARTGGMSEYYNIFHSLEQRVFRRGFRFPYFLKSDTTLSFLAYNRTPLHSVPMSFIR